MSMLQSILLATDFCPASLEATEVAEKLAEVFGSRFTLCHVFHPVPVPRTTTEELHELATWELQELAQRLAGKGLVVTETMVASGHPAAMIVRKAREIDADLILIGAGKWSGKSPFFAGAIAEAILHHASQPVLAVRPGKPALAFRRILCPVDQSAVSERGLRTAIALAKTFGGKVHVVTVIPEMSWLPASWETGKLADAVAEHKRKWREEFDQFLARIDFMGVPCTRETRVGVTHEEIQASAAEHRADLIVMGSTGRTGLAGMLMGSVARRVLQQLPCSLLTVKAEDVAVQWFEEDVQQINCLMAEGRELSEAGSYSAAMAKFRQVLSHDPFHGPALENLAEIHQRLGQVEKAEDCRRRAALVHQRAECVTG